MAQGRQYKFGLIITGDPKGGIKALKETGKAVDRLGKDTNDITKAFKRLELQNQLTTKSLFLLKGAATAAAIALGGFGFTRLVRDAAEFQTALIGVAKTTNLAGKELVEIANKLSNLSTKIPVTAVELLELAQAAGQMGVKGVADITKFAEVVAKLGRTTDIAGEEAARMLARILNITSESASEVDRLASVLVELGNKFAATESEIIEVATEVAKATNIFHFGSTQVLGYAAAMKSLGIRSEAGGTAIGRVLMVLTKLVDEGGPALDELAKKLNTTADSFFNLWNEDKEKGLTFFIKQLGEMSESEAVLMLDKLQLGGQRSGKTILTLANNFEKLHRAIALAEAEAIKMTALDVEFERAASTFASSMQKFLNVITQISEHIGLSMLPSLDNLISAMADFAKNAHIPELVTDLADWVKVSGTLAISLGGLSVAIWGLNQALIAMGVIASIGGSLGLLVGLQTAGLLATGAIVSLGLALKGLALAHPVITTLVAAIAAISFAKWLGEIKEVHLAIVSFATNAQKTWLRFQHTIQDVVFWFGNLNKTEKERKFILDSLAKAQLAELTTLNDFTTVVMKLAAGISDLNDETKENTELTDENTEARVESTKAIEEEAKRISLIINLVKQWGLAIDQQLSAEKLLRKGIDDTIDTMIKMDKVADKVTKAADPFAKAWAQGVKRVDRAFFNLFRSAFDGFESFKDQLINSMKDLMAQLAYEIVKRKLIIAIGSAVGTGISTAAASTAGAAGGSALGAVGGAGIGAALGTLGSRILEKIPPGLGGGGPVGGSGGGFSVSGAIQGVGAGLLGGFLGTKFGSMVTGKQANSSIGATAGAFIGSFWGPLGTGIGAAIGGFLDSVFGSPIRDPKLTIKPTTEAQRGLFQTSRDDFGVVTSSAFGNISAISQHDFGGVKSQQGKAIGNFLENIALLEDSLAATLDETVNESVKAAVSRQKGDKSGDIVSFIAKRFNTIFNAIGGEMDKVFDKIAKGVDSATLVANLDRIIAAVQTIAFANEELTSYLNKFGVFRDSQQVYIDGQKELQEVFGALGLELPKTAEGFRQLLENLDVMNEKERESFTILLNLVPELSQFYTELERVVQQVTNSIDSLVDAVFGSISLDSLIGIEVSRLEDANRLAQELYTVEIRRYEESLRINRTLLKSAQDLLLGPDSPLTPTERKDEATRRFDDLLTKALEGDVQAAADLSAFASNYIAEVRAFYGGGGEFKTLFDATVASLEAVTEKFKVDEPVELVEETTSDLLESLLAAQAVEFASQLQTDREDLLAALIEASNITGTPIVEMLTSLNLALPDLIALLDADISGGVEPAELVGLDAETIAALAALDINQDGIVTRLEALVSQAGEFTTLLETDREDLLAAFIEASNVTGIPIVEMLTNLDLVMSDLILLLDADQSGTVTEDETIGLDAETIAVLTSLDTNQDGILTRLEALDVNQDGVIGLIELMNARSSTVEAALSDLDTDNDKIITTVEAGNRLSEDVLTFLANGQIKLDDGSLTLALQHLTTRLGQTNFEPTIIVNVAQPNVIVNVEAPNVTVNAPSSAEEPLPVGPPADDAIVTLTSPNTINTNPFDDYFGSRTEGGSPFGRGLARGGITTKEVDVSLHPNEAILPLGPFNEKLNEVVSAVNQLAKIVDYHGSVAEGQRDEASEANEAGLESISNNIIKEVSTVEIL